MSSGAVVVRAARHFGSAVGSVFRHEWRSLAHAPTTPVLLGGFWLALAASVFVAGGFYDSDHASASLLWTFLPWVALVFVPALAMRAYGDDPGERGLELMLSLPVSDVAIAGGKWLAGAALTALMLAGTFPFVVTLGYLGAPDWGALAAGYLGAWLLLAGFLAVALFAAAMVREATGSYVLGLALLLVLLLAGWDATARAAAETPFSGLFSLLGRLSPKLWLDRMQIGRVELGALVSASALVGASLAGAVAAIGARRRGRRFTPPDLRSVGSALVVLVLLAAASAMASRLPQLADLSEGRAYTLHPESIAAARDAPPGTRIDYYWSATDRHVPAEITAHAARVRALLGGLAHASGGRITFVEHDAAPDSDAEAEAQAAGLRPVPMSSGGVILLGARFQHGERLGTITYFDVRREGQLEYDIAQAITSLGRPRTPRIGLLTPFLAPRHAQGPREGLAVLEELKRAYDVAIVPHFADALPEGLDAVVVIGASILKHNMLYSLDQHVMRGRGLVVLIDPHTRFNAGSDVTVPAPSAEIDDISDLLLSFGLRFHPDEVVGDASRASTVAGDDGREIVYPFWMRLGRSEITSTHPVTSGLADLLFAEAGRLSIERPERATALVTVGPSSGALTRAESRGKSAAELAALFRADGRQRILAAALVGPFDSAFAALPGNRPAGAAHVMRSSGQGVVFAVADTDFVFDPLSLTGVVAGAAGHSRPLNDNTALFLNMIEMAAGDPRLLAIRSRSTAQRPFKRVADLVRGAQDQLRDEEQRLMGAIGKVEIDIRKVLEVAGVKQASELPPVIRQQVRALIDALKPIKRELRLIRAGMRADVERLGRRLMAANLAAGPLLALLFALLARWVRRRRHRQLRAE